jgi:hypothetical protein
MQRVTLHEFENSEIKVSQDIYFNEKNQLIFEGYDIGKKVLALKGDSDYEYYYTIESTEVKKMAKLFDIDDSEKYSILTEIKRRFAGNESYSRFGAFMRENDIAFSQFTW